MRWGGWRSFTRTLRWQTNSETEKASGIAGDSLQFFPWGVVEDTDRAEPGTAPAPLARPPKLSPLDATTEDPASSHPEAQLGGIYIGPATGVPL